MKTGSDNGTKICKRKGCGKTFTSKMPWRKYCSPQCGDRVRQAKRAKRVRAALAMAEDRQMEERANG